MARGFTCAGQTDNPSTAARDAPALGDVTFPADTAGARGPRYITGGRRWISRFCENNGKTHSRVYREENGSRSCGKITHTAGKTTPNTIQQFHGNQSSVFTLFTRTFFFGLFMYKNVEIMQTEGGFEPNTS